jgi:hypothetical protein
VVHPRLVRVSVVVVLVEADEVPDLRGRELGLAKPSGVSLAVRVGVDHVIDEIAPD